MKKPEDWTKEFDDAFAAYFGHGGEDSVKKYIQIQIDMAYLRGFRAGLEQAVKEHKKIKEEFLKKK